MGAQGTTLVDFGAFPGKTDATVAVAGQGAILTGSLAEAWLFPADTVDHTIDEHVAEGPQVFARDVVAATGFTIQGVTKSGDLVYGKWNVAWVWN